MKHDRRRVTAVSWVLAVVVPPISAAGSYLWAALTTPALECATGSGGSNVNFVIFFLLVLAAPVAIAWHVRRAGRSIFDHLLPIFTSVILGFVLVFFGFQLWLTGHNCMT